MKTIQEVINSSFGKDSTAMVLKLIEEKYPLDEVVFYDTGMEFDCIYNVRDKIVNILNQHNITYTELKPQNTFLYDMLIHPKTKRKTGLRAYGNEWCGKCRWHTFIKQRICNQYTGTNNHVYIGIAQDEPKRLEKLDTFKSSPLAEWGMTEKDCLEYCHNHGIFWQEGDIELYDILDRVSCWCCQNKNLKELKSIYLCLPKYWEMLKGLQSRIDTPMKGEGKSVFDLEERFKKEIGDTTTK